jgi:hypothetical protein
LPAQSVGKGLTVVGQVVPMHAVVPEDTPTQSAPPPDGAGHPHVRVWNIVPAPHGLLHAELEMGHQSPLMIGSGQAT